MVFFSRALFDAAAHVYAIRPHLCYCVSNILRFEPSSENDRPAVLFGLNRQFPIKFFPCAAKLPSHITVQEKCRRGIFLQRFQARTILDSKGFNYRDCKLLAKCRVFTPMELNTINSALLNAPFDFINRRITNTPTLETNGGSIALILAASVGEMNRGLAS